MLSLPLEVVEELLLLLVIIGELLLLVVIGELLEVVGGLLLLLNWEVESWLGEVLR